jgi:ABC-type nitrate/sulfonate/bicarbonate transport system ATPase subunit
VSASVPALETRGLVLSWDGTREVLRDVNLCVRDGEMICLVGRSGCGKTTLLHALSGLLAPLRGEVLLHGVDLGGVPGKVSYMFQRDLLLPNLRVVDNVALPLVIGGMSKAEARTRALPLLERFGLADAGQAWPSELSGGMRQRVAFLRTYLMGNDVMLLDEPFSALDAITRRDLRSWYVDMATELGISSLMITHDVDEAVLLADRVYVLGPTEPGGPTGVVGCVDVEREMALAADFELTPTFAETKREVLALLG